MNTFKANTTRTTHMQGGSNYNLDVTILSRTENTVTFIAPPFNREPKRKKIHTDDLGEYFYPLGKYSMCPVCRA